MNDSSKRTMKMQEDFVELENSPIQPNDRFAKDRIGDMLSPYDPGYEALIADIFATMKRATEMNTGYRTPEEVHEYMEGILGKPLDRSTTVLPPLYIDYGKPVTIGGGGVFHSTVLHILRTRRYHNRQRCVHRSESQSDHNQPRP